MSVSELPLTGPAGPNGTEPRIRAATGVHGNSAATGTEGVTTGLAEVVELPLPRASPGPAAPIARRWPGYVLIVGGTVLVPWLVLLALTLPQMTLAWVGFDAMEAAGMITTGVLVLRGHPLRAGVAGATATLLLVDAWFDTTTSTGSDLAFALVLAGVAELPLAALCATLAVRSVSPRQQGPSS